MVRYTVVSTPRGFRVRDGIECRLSTLYARRDYAQKRADFLNAGGRIGFVLRPNR